VLRDEHDDDTAEWLHALHQQAMRFAHGHPGVLVEDKGVGLALHWRGAPHAASDVRAFADRHVRAAPATACNPATMWSSSCPSAPTRAVPCAG
jgi:trehalose 6-phosphate phosphatase